MKNYKRGFTVVEVLIVWATLGLIALFVCGYFVDRKWPVASVVSQGQVPEPVRAPVGFTTNGGVVVPPGLQCIATNSSAALQMKIEVSPVPFDPARADDVQAVIDEMPDSLLKANLLVTLAAHYAGG